MSGGKNLDYNKKYDGKEVFFIVPEHTVYYMVSLGFETSDMIDNTKLNLGVMARGNLHKEERSVHMIGPSLKATIGNNLAIMIGYDYYIGDVDECHSTSFAKDKDAFTGSLTYYFM